MKERTTDALFPEDERRGIVWQVAGGGYVGALCHGAPRDVVLESLVEWSRRQGRPLAGLFIEDLRGGLEATRTGCLRRLSAALDAPVAVMTRSRLTRSAAACRWLGERVFAFGRHGLEEAFERLAVPEPERDAIRAALRALRVARRLDQQQRSRTG